MQSKNTAAVPQKARRSPAAPLLTVTLDARASAAVRAWAEILQRDIDDVANGLLAENAENELQRYRQDEPLRAAGKTPTYGEQTAEVERCIREAQKRRETLLELQRGGALSFSKPLAVTLSGKTSYAIRNFAYFGNVSERDLVEEIVANDVKCCQEDYFNLLATVESARKRGLARK